MYNRGGVEKHKAQDLGQGQRQKKSPRPRPRTDFSRTDTLEAKDRNARGQRQGHKDQVFSKKKGLSKFPARFLAFSNKILTFQKIVLSSAEAGQLEASRPRT